MIVRRGFRIAEPPRASVGRARLAPVTKHRNRMRIALRLGARAPPEPRSTQRSCKIVCHRRRSAPVTRR